MVTVRLPFSLMRKIKLLADEVGETTEEWVGAAALSRVCGKLASDEFDLDFAEDVKRFNQGGAS